MERRAEVTRQTQETTVTIRVNMDGSGQNKVSTGVPFLDHMLTQVAMHGLIDLTVLAQGDVHVDDHHTVEDVGIVLGQALRKALGDGKGLARYGAATIPMVSPISTAPGSPRDALPARCTSTEGICN